MANPVKKDILQHGFALSQRFSKRAQHSFSCVASSEFLRLPRSIMPQIGATLNLLMRCFQTPAPSRANQFQSALASAQLPSRSVHHFLRQAMMLAFQPRQQPQ